MEQYKNQVVILLTNIESRTSDKTADKIYFPMVIFSFHQGWKTQGCQFSSNLVKLVMLICSLCLRTIPVTIPSQSGKNSKLVSDVCWGYLKRLSRKIKGFVANVLSLFSSLFLYPHELLLTSNDYVRFREGQYCNTCQGTEMQISF